MRTGVFLPTNTETYWFKKRMGLNHLLICKLIYLFIYLFIYFDTGFETLKLVCYRMASKNNSEEPFTDGAYSYPMECLRSLVGGVSPETRWDRRYLPAVLEDGQGYTESASMAQSPSVATFVQQSHQVVQQKPDETAPLKRRKKEPGAPTKKSVVVLKGSDVTKRDGLVFMPNTIEMANLKKTEKGQFKKMQMSSKMSETEIGQTLTALFPNLKNKRYD